MRLTSKFIAACFFAVAFSTSAIAGARGFYSAGFMGLKLPENASFSASAAPASSPFAGAIGFRLAPRWRVESELSYRMDETPGDGSPDSRFEKRMKSWAGLANVYYDFDAPGKLRPFIGAGAGYVSQYAEEKGESGALAWQAGAGLNYRASENLSFTGAYRYLDHASFYSDDIKSDYGGHGLHFGFTYNLPFKPAPRPRPNN